MEMSDEVKNKAINSPEPGSSTGCQCPDGSYSPDCCDGSLEAQGIGSLTGGSDYIVINARTIKGSAILSQQFDGEAFVSRVLEGSAQLSQTFDGIGINTGILEASAQLTQEINGLAVNTGIWNGASNLSQSFQGQAINLGIWDGASNLDQLFDGLAVGTIVSNNTGAVIYQAVLDYATLKGYAHPSQSVQNADIAHIDNLIALNIWGKLPRYYMFHTDGDQDFACIDWTNPSDLTQAIRVNSPIFAPFEGFKGNGTTSYIRTQFNPSTSSFGNYGITNASIGGIFENIGDAKSQIGATSGFGQPSHRIRMRHDVNNWRFGFNSSSTGSGPHGGMNGGWLMVSRTDSLNQFVHTHLTSGLYAFSTSSIPNLELYILGINSGGNPGELDSCTALMSYIGEDLQAVSSSFRLEVYDRISKAEAQSNYTTILNQAVIDGFTAPDAYYRYKQNRFAKRMNAVNAFNAFDWISIIGSDGDIDFACYNWKTPGTNDFLRVNSPTFLGLDGFHGDGVSAYMDTQQLPGTFTQYQQGDASWFFVISQTWYATGIFGTDDNSNKFFPAGSTNLRFRHQFPGGTPGGNIVGSYTTSYLTMMNVIEDTPVDQWYWYINGSLDQQGAPPFAYGQFPSASYKMFKDAVGNFTNSNIKIRAFGLANGQLVKANAQAIADAVNELYYNT